MTESVKLPSVGDIILYSDSDGDKIKTTVASVTTDQLVLRTLGSVPFEIPIAVEWFEDESVGWFWPEDSTPNEDPFVTNIFGGRQSKVAGRFDLIPPSVLREVAEVLEKGAEKYGQDNWKLITRDEHVNHAVAHLYKLLEGDTSENHLVNVICRAMFARWMEKHGPNFNETP